MPLTLPLVRISFSCPGAFLLWQDLNYPIPPSSPSPAGPWPQAQQGLQQHPRQQLCSDRGLNTLLQLCFESLQDYQGPREVVKDVLFCVPAVTEVIKHRSKGVLSLPSEAQPRTPSGSGHFQVSQQPDCPIGNWWVTAACPKRWRSLQMDTERSLTEP